MSFIDRMINSEDLSKIHLKDIPSSDKYIRGYMEQDDEFSTFMQDMDHLTGGFTKTSRNVLNQFRSFNKLHIGPKYYQNSFPGSLVTSKAIVGK